MEPGGVRFRLAGRVAVVQLDDGKANALSPGTIRGLEAALDRAEGEAAAVLLLGRPGRFSAGFDLTVMRSGAEAARDLVTAGAELLLRQLELPFPLVAACTGHAIAAGALLLLAADLRLGARGEYRLGLNEVAIGLPLPIFAIELARERLSRRIFERATSQAELYGPEAGLEAGFLDRLVDAGELEAAALAEAARLAELPQPAFGATKRRAHEALCARVRDTLRVDMARLTGLR
jgi:enoyl-CoA hydratase